MYAAAGGASLAGRKARQHGRQPAPPSPNALSPVHPAPSGVRLYSCQHWESRLLAPPPRTLSALEPPTPCDVVECAAGRAAWQEAAALSVGGGGAGAGGAARRCSVLGDHPGARGKWHRTNRVRDASYGSSSDSDVEEGAAGEPWGVARLLYAGLATLALGLVVYFVGTGDKGFKTPALRLVGPSLIVAGLACCLLRIMFCIFAKPCCRRRTNHKENRRLSGGVEGEEMPLARCAGSRQGPAQCSPARRLDASSCDVSSLSSGEEDERLRRYRTANATTTHLQPQTVHVQPAGSQQKPSPSPSPQPGSHQPVPQQSASQQPTPIQPAPHQAASHQSAPHQSAPLQPTPHPSAPHQAASHQAAPLQPAPHQAASHQPTPHPSALHQSAPHQPAVPGKRPPPRNVSFAGGPDGELVLSPAQLRS